MADNGKIMLVTGVTGYIPSHILRTFLEAGYNIRAAVRCEAEAKDIREAHPGYKENRLSFVLVPNIVKEGAFDDAVKDVHGVIHTAFPPIPTDIVDREKSTVIPAIDTMANSHNGCWPGHVYTEADWNPDTYEIAIRTRLATQAQYASRKLAEKTAWNYMRNEKPMFDLVTLCIPVVWGPLTSPIPSLSRYTDMGIGVGLVYKLMDGSLGQYDVPSSFYPFVDVRDVANAALKAYEVADAADERFFIVSGRCTSQMICDILRIQFPELRDRVPIGNPGMAGLEHVYDVDGSKAQRILGIKYRGLLEIITDTAQSLLAMEKKDEIENAEGFAKLAAAFRSASLKNPLRRLSRA